MLNFLVGAAAITVPQYGLPLVGASMLVRAARSLRHSARRRRLNAKSVDKV